MDGERARSGHASRLKLGGLRAPERSSYGAAAATPTGATTTSTGTLAHAGSSSRAAAPSREANDVYFSADVETDGPIPGPFSMLSFALVPAGHFNGRRFRKPRHYRDVFYRELKPISTRFQHEALEVNGLDRKRLCREGADPAEAMADARNWIINNSTEGTPVLVAYPLSFDWSWLYWYFVRFVAAGSPFNHSQCFDLKTAYAVKAAVPIVRAGRARLPALLRPPTTRHTHNAADDAIEQARIFARVFRWGRSNERDR